MPTAADRWLSASSPRAGWSGWADHETRAPPAVLSSKARAQLSGRIRLTTPHLLQPHLGRAIPTARVRLGREARDVLAASQRIAHGLTDRAGAFAMHDPRFGHTNQRRVLQVLLEALQ